MGSAARLDDTWESAVGQLGSADFSRLERKESAASRWGFAAFGAADDLAFPALDALAPGLIAEPGLMVAAIGALCVKELGEAGLHWMEQRKLRILGEKCQNSFEAAQSCLSNGDGAGVDSALNKARIDCEKLGEEMRGHAELLKTGSNAELSASKFESWAYKSCAEPLLEKAKAQGLLGTEAVEKSKKAWSQESRKLASEEREDFIKASHGKIGLAALGSPVLVEAEVPEGVAVPKYKKIWSALKSEFPLATSIADDIAYPALGALGLAGAEPALLIGAVGAVCVGSLAMAAKADWESHKIKVASIHAGEAIKQMNQALRAGDSDGFKSALGEAMSAAGKVETGLESTGQRLAGLSPSPMDAKAFERWMEHGIAMPALAKAKSMGLVDKADIEAFEGSIRRAAPVVEAQKQSPFAEPSPATPAPPAIGLEGFRARRAAQEISAKPSLNASSAKPAMP